MPTTTCRYCGNTTGGTHPVCDAYACINQENREETMSEPTYKIVRHFFNDDIPRRTIKTGLTLEEAQAHCNDPETSSSTCTTASAKRRTQQYGDWFDGYMEEGR